MKKIVLTALICAALFSNAAMAKDACATIMCLGGTATGKGGLMCKQAIDDYFDIKKYRHGKYSEDRTLAARTSYLNQCSSDNNEEAKVRINATFGIVYSAPGKLY